LSEQPFLPFDPAKAGDFIEIRDAFAGTGVPVQIGWMIGYGADGHIKSAEFDLMDDRSSVAYIFEASGGVGGPDRSPIDDRWQLWVDDPN